MRRFLAAMVAVLTGTSAAAAQPAFRCTADLATGFAWDGTAWQHATPETLTNQYTVEPLAQEVVFLRGREYTFRVFPDHDPAADLLCEYIEPQDRGARLYYGDLIPGFVLDFETSRYTALSTPGLGDDANAITPRIEIGTCRIADGPR